MTRFIDGSKKSEPKKQVKETVFTHFVNANKEIEKSASQPLNYINVEFLFYDIYYGDVFKATHKDDDEDNATLFFGTKGDEDYEQG